MKLLADMSAVLKLAAFCLVVGFVMGFCLRGAPAFTAPAPAPSTSEVTRHDSMSHTIGTWREPHPGPAVARG
jgi:hypothetical protein